MSVVKNFIIFLGIIFLIIIVATLFYEVADINRDSTDSPWLRSGMNIKVDNETGCQYLLSIDSCLTPRLDDKGNHICD